MTQRQLADAVGVGQSTWSRVETGISGLNVEQLQAAARVLGCTGARVLELADTAAAQLADRGVLVLDQRPAVTEGAELLKKGLIMVAIASIVAVVFAAIASTSKAGKR